MMQCPCIAGIGGHFTNDAMSKVLSTASTGGHFINDAMSKVLSTASTGGLFINDAMSMYYKYRRTLYQ